MFGPKAQSFCSRLCRTTRENETSETMDTTPSVKTSSSISVFAGFLRMFRNGIVRIFIAPS